MTKPVEDRVNCGCAEVTTVVRKRERMNDIVSNERLALGDRFFQQLLDALHLAVLISLS